MELLSINGFEIVPLMLMVAGSTMFRWQASVVLLFGVCLAMLQVRVLIHPFSLFSCARNSSCCLWWCQSWEFTVSILCRLILLKCFCIDVHPVYSTCLRGLFPYPSSATKSCFCSLVRHEWGTKPDVHLCLKHSFCCPSVPDCLSEVYARHAFNVASELGRVAVCYLSTLQARILPACYCVLWKPMEFDATCGYPGEGPPWTLASINCGSLQKHEQIYDLDYQCIAIQETRVCSANLKSCELGASKRNFSLHNGALRKYLTSGQPDWGGVAIAAPQGASRPLTNHDDESLNYPALFSSGRVCASWITVSEGLVMLLICVYAHTNAQRDIGRHVANDHIFQQIAELCSQYGDIPIIVAGDYQNIPNQYPSLQEALSQGLFHDLLSDGCGLDEPRPCTYSRTKNWSQDTSGNSSIDAVLVNSTAARFVEKINVRRTQNFQHAFLEVTFQWPEKITGLRQCKRWVPHAALDLSQLCDVEQRKNIAEQLWNSNFAALSNQAESTEELNKIANQFALQILLQSGAVWRHGTKERGSVPPLQPSTVPIHEPFPKDKATKQICEVNRMLNRIDDIASKLATPVPPPHAFIIIANAWKKLVPYLLKLVVKMLSIHLRQMESLQYGKWSLATKNAFSNRQGGIGLTLGKEK